MSFTSRSCESSPALTLKTIRARHAQCDTVSTSSISDNTSCADLDLDLLEDSSSDDDHSPCAPYSGAAEADGWTSSRRCSRSASESTSRKAATQAPLAAVNPMVQVSVTVDPVERYEVISEIRTSLFGTVVLAHDAVCNQDVAIKLSNTDLAEAGVSMTGYTVIENPLSETALLRQLPLHPFIVALRREHLVDNVHWTVMEYVPSGDLFEHLLQTDCVEPRAARRCIRQIAQALLHMHSHKMCHLDVSLENVLVDDKCNVKLTDFGVARSFANQSSSVFPGIQEAEKPGKVRYMAPEMLAGQAFDGCLVDSFALGVIMFCLLVGSAPFETAHPTNPRWQLISSGDFKTLFELTEVTGPSASAVDLLKGLLTTADKRMTMAAVLKHPWFNEEAML